MTNEQNRQDRRKQLEELYLRNYGRILDSALADRRLLVQDGERVAESLTKYLPDYDGPLDDEPFQQWATEIIRPAVSRLGSLYDMRREYGPWVRGVIRRTLGHTSEFDDLNAVVEELENDVWMWAGAHIKSLLIPGTAKLSTRLCARAIWAARAWRTKQILRRDAVVRRIATVAACQSPFLQCEVMTDAELASAACDK